MLENRKSVLSYTLGHMDPPNKQLIMQGRNHILVDYLSFSFSKNNAKYFFKKTIKQEKSRRNLEENLMPFSEGQPT